MFRLRLLLLCLFPVLLMACSSASSVKPLDIGSQVDFSLLEDQFGHAFHHEDVMETVLYVNDMQGKQIVREALEAVDLSCLDGGRVVYLADISGMPSLISKLIAVPRMRDYDYPVWLDYSGLATEALPAHEDEVTLIRLKAGAIQSMDFVTDSQTLKTQLLGQCGPARQQVAGA